MENSDEKLKDMLRGKTDNKADIKFRAGHVQKTELENILQKEDLFKQKGLAQVQNTSTKIIQQIAQNNSLEL